MKVIKRNGLEEQFEWDKIRNVLDRAFKSVGETLTEDMYIDIIDELYFGDDKGILRESISVEELQDQLEQALFECGYFEVAKSFILYSLAFAFLQYLCDKIYSRVLRNKNQPDSPSSVRQILPSSKDRLPQSHLYGKPALPLPGRNRK